MGGDALVQVVEDVAAGLPRGQRPHRRYRDDRVGHVADPTAGPRQDWGDNPSSPSLPGTSCPGEPVGQRPRRLVSCPGPRGAAARTYDEG